MALLKRERTSLNNLKDVDTRTTQPADTNVLQYQAATKTWVPVTGPGGGSGELNTGSNIGTSGVPVYDSKTGVDLKFRSINVGSNKLTITYNTVTNSIDLDLAAIAADELTDIDTTSVPPNLGEALVWDGTNWTPQEVGDLPQYIKEVDFDEVNNYVYQGEAAPGSVVTDSAWRITRTEFVGNDEDVIKLFAAGSASFNQVWNNRGLLGYS